MDLFLTLLIIQALMGAFDTIYHHELTVALPRSVTARQELTIHAVRALLYGVIFAGLAWFEWQGLWALVLIAIVLIEVGLTLWDFVIEDATRVLPKSERITHTLLAINGGAAFGLLALELPRWFALPTDLVFVDYGWRSWFLVCAGAGVAISGLRDGWAAWSLQRLDLRVDMDLGASHRRLLISGGTGFIGSAAIREFLRAGHAVTVLTRRPVAAAVQFSGRVRSIRSTTELADDESFDAVINLAGAPVIGPLWTAKRKRVLLESRLDTTADLLRFVKRAHHRPQVWVQASAIGYYGPQTDGSLDETAPAGDGFAAHLCRQWEDMTAELHALAVRSMTLRLGLVFGRSGGSLPMLLLSHRFAVGAILGDGKQHMGWIHIEDLLQLFARAIADPTWHGVINAVAPDSPTNEQFAQLAARLLKRPLWMHIPAGILRRALGEMASLLVDGPKIEPARLRELRFEYRFPSLRSALMDLS